MMLNIFLCANWLFVYLFWRNVYSDLFPIKNLSFYFFLPTHWKRLWCWEELGAGGEGDDRGWDGWMASLTRWTWVWVNSGSGWWTGRPGVLRFMGSQRVRHHWVTELNNWRSTLMDSAYGNCCNWYASLVRSTPHFQVWLPYNMTEDQKSNLLPFLVPSFVPVYKQYGDTLH